MAFQSSFSAALDLDAGASEKEFAFSDADFRSLSALAYEHAGIVLSDSKRNLVYSRLSRRLRAIGLKTFHDYIEVLASRPSELEHFINAISTNLTKMFRETHHFEHLKNSVVMPFAKAPASVRRRLRIWSAGCSTGEEPYTIASVLLRDLPGIVQRDVLILATDIDTEVLGKASQGRYPLATLNDVPSEYHKIIQPAVDVNGKTFQVDQNLRNLIRFKQLNLLTPWPFAGPFDAIFCRNVMIYFDGPTKAKLIARFAEKIAPGGWLYIGHSESMLGTNPYFELVGRTIYRRRA